MAAIFPFGYPLPTAFYLVLYVLTLIGHVIFMNYVLAGCCYLAFVNVFPGSRENPRHKQPLAVMLADWMPFAISAAITMGVAPLLFIQILYKERFYTANLLLSHRWMIMLPVLILGFYLTYVVRSWLHREPHRFTRFFVAVLAFACFLFAAGSWSENHLLSLDRESWPQLYESESLRYPTIELVPRVIMWLVGAFPTMCVLLAWQFVIAKRYKKNGGEHAPNNISAISLSGLVLAVIAAVAYALIAGRGITQVLRQPSHLVYLAIALLGWGIQFAGWLQVRRTQALSTNRLALISTGMMMTLLGATVLRELHRLSRVDITGLYAQHASFYQSGGFRVFLLFAVVNTALIAWSIRIVARAVTHARPQNSE